MIFLKIFLTLIFMKKAPTCSRGWSVYRKNKNNFVECFKIGGNRAKMSKIFTFGSIFENTRIGRSVPDACKYFQIFEFSSFFSIFELTPNPSHFFDL